MDTFTYQRKTPPEPAAFRQVLGLLRGETPPDQLISQTTQWSDATCEQFLQATRYHKVQEPVLRRLLAGRIPLDQRLRGVLESAASANQLVRQGVADADAELARALGQADLPWIALKGLTYQQRYWGSRQARHVRDLDLLVTPESLDAVVAILKQQGFVPADAAHKAFSRRRRRLDHAANMVRAGLTVDVHWQLRNPGVYRIDYDRIWRTCMPAPGAPRTKRWLNEADDLHFILLSIAHDIQRGACRLKHLLDARLILESCHRSLNWAEFLTLRTAEHTLDVVLNSLDVARRVLSFQHRFPGVNEILEKRRDRLVCATNQEAEQLLAGRRGNANNQRWFGSCYPELSWNSIVNFVDRNVLCPRRIPWALIKGYRRFAGK